MGPILSATIFGGATGFCTARYLEVAPALGISVAAITDRAFSYLVSNLDRQEQFDKRVADFSGVAAGMILTDNLFHPFSRDKNAIVLDYMSKITTAFLAFKGVQTAVQYLSPSKLFIKAAQIPYIRYFPEAGITIVATKIIKNRLLPAEPDLSKLTVFGFAVVTLMGFAITDIAIPIITKIFIPKKDSSNTLIETK